ncbi:MAG: transposase, partial [Paracoccaceae bacterium]
DEIVLFKCLLTGQWHGLSDPKLEENLRARFDALLFAGLDLHYTVWDETTHCRSRNARVKADGLATVYFQSLSSNIFYEGDREWQRGTQTRSGLTRFAWRGPVA